MNLQLPTDLAKSYTSKAQQVRVMTEEWVRTSLYCPVCGNVELDKFDNNKPVGDFYCATCKAEFELKSKGGKLGARIADGAYDTMMRKIKSKTNPHFLFLNYDKDYKVQNLLGIPQHFFTPQAIIKRNALAASARRAGWVGCDIQISDIPSAGKISLIRDYTPHSVQQVTQAWGKTRFIADVTVKSRGWLLDVLHCVEKIPNVEFSLQEAYAFTHHLQNLHPENKNIEAKIRQQLQILRDQNIISFLGAGKYRREAYQ